MEEKIFFIWLGFVFLIFAIIAIKLIFYPFKKHPGTKIYQIYVNGEFQDCRQEFEKFLGKAGLEAFEEHFDDILAWEESALDLAEKSKFHRFYLMCIDKIRLSHGRAYEMQYLYPHTDKIIAKQRYTYDEIMEIYSHLPSSGSDHLFVAQKIKIGKLSSRATDLRFRDIKTSK